MKNIISITLIAVSVAVFFVYIDPLYKEIKSSLALRQLYADSLDQSQEIIDIRDGFLGEYRSLPQEDLLRLKKMLPDNVDNVRLIMDIDGIASTNNINIKSVQAVDSARNPSDTSGSSELYNSLTLKFSFKTSYVNFANFIKDLENNLRLSDVTAVTIKTGENGLDEFGVTLRTYWIK